MEDRSHEILSQYELQVYHKFRARGAVILETDRGPKLLQAFTGREQRLYFEDALKRHITAQGCTQIDAFLYNTSGSLLSVNSVGERFYVKDWFDGEECALKREENCLLAVKNLSCLHLAMRQFRPEPPTDAQETAVPPRETQSLPELLSRRAREMKHVRTYIRNKKQKNEFELLFLKLCDTFYEQAAEAVAQLHAESYRILALEAEEGLHLYHGSYNYHNLFLPTQAATAGAAQDAACFLQAASLHAPNPLPTTNFDRAGYGIQLTDFYQFLRKVMEKNDWSIPLGKRLIEAYDHACPLSAQGLSLLRTLLLFPEKFWKITNAYYNNRKSWIPKKNLQKLQMNQEQLSRRCEFIAAL